MSEFVLPNFPTDVLLESRIFVQLAQFKDLYEVTSPHRAGLLKQAAPQGDFNGTPYIGNEAADTCPCPQPPQLRPLATPLTPELLTCHQNNSSPLSFKLYTTSKHRTP